MKDYRNLLIAAGYAETDGQIVGASHQELLQLARQVGGLLPTIYQDFMSVCGRRAGRFALDIDLFFPDVLELREEVLEMLEETDSQYRLSPTALVFAGYQGGQYLLFDCKSGDDPAVFRLWDDGQEPTQVAERLSSFLVSMVIP